jgi:hypothetical protein
MFKHIREMCKWEAEERRDRVHIIQEMPFPIQVIESGKLEEPDDIWIRELRREHREQSL